MALLALSDDALGVIFEGLRNTLDPRVILALSSACHGLRALTPALLLQQLRTDHEAAAALCRKMEMSCNELREAKRVDCRYRFLSATDLATLGKLGSMLPALESLYLVEHSGAASLFMPKDGVQRLAEELGAGALPAVTLIAAIDMPVGDAGASALAAALGRGALPRLERLSLSGVSGGASNDTDIGDAGLVALAPALRRLPALEFLGLTGNSFGDEGLAALVAPPPPAGALPPPKGGLTKLKTLNLRSTQITDAGCAALAAALDSGALPALKNINLDGTLASAAAQAAVQEALKRSTAAEHLRVLSLVDDAVAMIWCGGSGAC